MMYKKLRNALRGTVSAAVECAMPERVLNLCAVEQVPFWDLQWVDEIHLTLCTTRAGAEQLRRIAEKTAAHVTFGAEKGMPVLAGRLRRRYMLLAALGLFLGALWYGSNFVWTLEVTGNETVSTTAILRALEKQGVRAGIRATAIDQDVLRNHVLPELPDLSWLAVNVTGCTAHVQVVERHRPGTLVRDGEACDVAAARDGLVIRAETLRGRCHIQPGDTVSAGEILISGTAGDLHGAHAMGRIYARTWYTFTTVEPLAYEKKYPAGRSCTRRTVGIGKKQINFPGKGCTYRENCDKITVTQPLSLPFGLRLPLTWTREVSQAYETVPAQRSISQAQELAEQELLQQLSRELTEGGEIVSTVFTAEQDGTALYVTLTAECREDIARSVPIG